jgi:CRISPR-associated protein Csm1
MFKREEKIVVLAGLFHDVGKFRQRCTGEKIKHTELGYDFIMNEVKEEFTKILGNSEDAVTSAEIVRDHHEKPNSPLLKAIIEADHLSASERVDKELSAEGGIDWRHKYLSSLFSKIRLNSDTDLKLRYYKHELLTRENFGALIPKYDTESEAFEHKYKYNESDWESFKSDVKSALSFYETEEDFGTIIRLINIVFEKYIWCIPDFTGSRETDISLYNHMKDTAGFAHSIYLAGNESATSDKLALVTGDIPGIQNYIFEGIVRKPAKMLRGRSIYVQILTRNFATAFLDAFGLTECSLAMLAGGKFYIIAPFADKFTDNYLTARNNIEKYLINRFNFELKFTSSYTEFKYTELRDGKITFGELIESANEKLATDRFRIFNNTLVNNFSEDKFVIKDDFIENELDTDTNSIKCYLTDKPILKGHGSRYKFTDDGGKSTEKYVSSQAYSEYLTGEKVPYNNVIAELEKDNLSINTDKIYKIKDASSVSETRKILINPDLDELLKIKGDKKNIIKNSYIIETANYSMTGSDGAVEDFGTLSKTAEGAPHLTLIKGDIDNLGLIMSYGLDTGKEGLTSVSRITTLSNHLKYFFSFFMNGYLKNKKNVYTVFAGGDDMMLICHQSDSIKLLNDFNNTFKDFTCDNPEVHISYSLTGFNHSTPIKIVARMSDDNQEKAKKEGAVKETADNMPDDKACFHEEKNKASTYIFDTIVKNKELGLLEKTTEELAGWSKGEDPEISSGTLRHLFIISGIMKEWRETGNTAKLMWHPLLSYSINRNLKKKGAYKNTEVGKFFESVLAVSKDRKARELESIIYPAICSAIYKIRNFKQ